MISPVLRRNRPWLFLLDFLRFLLAPLGSYTYEGGTPDKARKNLPGSRGGARDCIPMPSPPAALLELGFFPVAPDELLRSVFCAIDGLFR